MLTSTLSLDSLTHPALTKLNHRARALRTLGIEPKCLIVGSAISRELHDLAAGQYSPLPPDTTLGPFPVVTVFHDPQAVQVGI